tara:strand:- start:17 stop:274 length:258 start_codon:yes stop_codon:yes gene_type:complete
MKYKFDKDIPIPETGRSTESREVHKALDAMEVGDSIEFCLDSSFKSGALYSKEGQRFDAIARRRGIKLTSRRDYEKKKIRYWRAE